jgi:hypothetical protein
VSKPIVITAKVALADLIAAGGRVVIEVEAPAGSTPESSVYPAWWPIEDAEPEDGKGILVATADTPPVVGEAWWRKDYDDKLDLWWAGTGPGDYHADPISQCNQRVTHWMPLPIAPESKP